MECKIRQAKLEDLKALKAIQKSLVNYERAFDPCIKKGKVEYYNLEKLIRSRKTNFLIIENKRRIIGCGFGQIRKSVEWAKHDCHGYVGLMFIDKRYRGRGLAKMIVDTLVLWFKERNISQVFLVVYKDNKGAVKAYKKLGFKDFSLEMKLNIN